VAPEYSRRRRLAFSACRLDLDRPRDDIQDDEAIEE
jgi:hypothetical protein